MLCELSDPPLSSVAPNSKRIGYEAAALLARMMSGRKPPVEPVFVEPEGVITRRSTEVLAIEDRHLANVVRFIREHACEGIDVSDVLKAVPLSRSALERRFARTLGRSPKEEILRVRLNRARQLLSETDFPLWTIAEKIGLEHTEYLNVIFKKKTGLTPGQFRAQGRGRAWREKQADSATG
jgi:LacI family transcriptional regulator